MKKLSPLKKQYIPSKGGSKVIQPGKKKPSKSKSDKSTGGTENAS